MIIEKIYYYLKLETLSPLSLGNGANEVTDHDLIRDAENKAFIPGSSIAGVFMHSLDEEDQKYLNPNIKASNQNVLSPLFISDAIATNKYVTSIRDGVALNEYKITQDGGKYDIEIVEKGLHLDFRMELTIRDNDDKDKMKMAVNKILNELINGNILFGMKVKRGFGKVKVLNIYSRTFKKENFQELLNFNKYDVRDYQDYPVIPYESAKYDTLTVELQQLGGISIRAYSAKAGDVDFEQIKSGSKPVIPGTSWNGLIRKQVNYYHHFLGFEDTELIDKWFGFANEHQAQASKIIIEESIIEGGKEITLMRSSVDRFSGGNADRALFDERSYFNGKTNLTMRIPKEIKITQNDKPMSISNQYILGLLALTLKDIDNGLIAIGGQTAIGRGLLKILKVTKNGQDISLDSLIDNIKLWENGKENTYE